MCAFPKGRSLYQDAHAASTQMDIGLQCRDALRRSSCCDRTASIPPEMLAALVAYEVWTPAQGLAYIWQMPEAAPRGRALAELAPHLPQPLLLEALSMAREMDDLPARTGLFIALIPFLPEAEREETLVRSITALREVDDARVQARLLAGLAPHLSPDWWDSVRGIAWGIVLSPVKVARASEGWLARALIRLAPSLEDDPLAEALDVTRQMPGGQALAQTLVGLASYLPEALLVETLQFSRKLEAVPRAKVLVGLSPHLPETCFVKVLEIVSEFLDGDAFARSLAGLAPYLPPALLVEALNLADEVKDEYVRTAALAALAPYLSAGLLGRILGAVRQIKYDYARAEALNGLASHLPEGLLPKALSMAWEIDQPFARDRALAGLVCRLAELDRLQEALSVVQEIHWEYTRAGVLAGLTGYLTEESLPDALSAARRLAMVDDRARVLIRLVPQLVEAERLEVMREVLDVMPGVSGECARSWVLDGLDRYFPPETQRRLWRLALGTVWDIEDESELARALACLVGYIPEEELEGIWAEALSVVRDACNETLSGRALVGLAPYLSGAQMAGALDVARGIADDHDRLYVLARLAPYVFHEERQDVLSEALAGAGRSSDEEVSVQVLAGLARYLPDEKREHVLAAALEQSRRIERAGPRDRALAEVASRLAEWGWPDEALAAVESIGNESDRVRALAGLIPHLPDGQREGLLGEVLDMIRLVETDIRAGALIRLIPWLPEEHLADALGTARRIFGLETRSEVLALLASRLSELGYLDEALTLMAEIKWDPALARALAGWLPHLPLEERDAVLVEVFDGALELEDELVALQVLAGLAPYLPEEWLATVLDAAREVSDDALRARMLTRLVSYAPAESQTDVVVEALRTARDIATESVRRPILEDLALHLAGLSRDVCYRLWQETLSALSERPRPELLADLGALAPVIAALGGPDAVWDLARAIEDESD